MSASLVGSEMCIRDSCWEGQIDTISGRTWGRCRSGRTEQGSHGVFPFPAGDGAARLQWLAQ
eukprot:14459805-Alexandrium_andersonii.AAC.1